MSISKMSLKKVIFKHYKVGYYLYYQKVVELHENVQKFDITSL